ncbi:MAG: LacI family transcriptional regulator [Litorilinea sp.]|nr:MAG: LacI family transcriptional regulator [Litorilinea sp.]
MSLSGNRRVTQRDVARRAGVSTSIVSYVINRGPRSVSPETRARVLKAIEELGYRPNRHAQFLTRAKEQSDAPVQDFGLVLGRSSAMLARPYYGEVLAGLYDEADAQHMRVRFIQSLEQLADPLLFNELIHPDEIAGVILFVEPGRVTPAAARLIDKMQKRIGNLICLEQRWGELPAVTFDRMGAARTAVSHLLDLGHRRVGFLGYPDDRLDGYRFALLDHDVPMDEELVCPTREGNTPAAGHRHVQTLMALADPPTALFACSDEVAVGVMSGLHELGLSVPEDVALVSIDDIPLARYLTPSLTTVHVPKADLGAHAVRMLRARALNPDQTPVSVVLPTSLIVRASCGARPAREVAAEDGVPPQPEVENIA